MKNLLFMLFSLLNRNNLGMKIFLVDVVSGNRYVFVIINIYYLYIGKQHQLLKTFLYYFLY